MAGKSFNQEIMYEEFEPFCKWQRKEDRDVLEVHLQDFKKEQLRVQISNHGILKISGERAIDNSKHTKFYKEVPAPSNKYDTNAIHAKFVDNILIITLPKPRTQSVNKPSPTDQFSKSTCNGNKGNGNGSGAAKEQTPAPTPTEGNVAMGECELKCRKKQRLTKVAASLAATAAAAVILAAYVHYMYKSTVDDVED